MFLQMKQLSHVAMMSKMFNYTVIKLLYPLVRPIDGYRYGMGMGYNLIGTVFFPLLTFILVLLFIDWNSQ